jgi:hypothetical protein
MADVAASLKDWSTTEGSNSPTDATTIGAGLADNLQQIQATVRDVFSRDTIASATTTDIGAKDAGALTVTGTTTITGFGTVSAGIRKWLTFEGALTLTHNATSLILPNAGSNITTAAGDSCEAESLGSGNWRVTFYQRANGAATANATTFVDGSVSAPSIAFTSDTNTGLYRAGTDTIGVAVGGQAALTASSSNGSGATLSGVAGPLNLTSGSGYSVIVQSGGTNGGEDTIVRGVPATGVSAAGGNVLLDGGSSTNGAGGDVNIKGGDGAPDGNVNLYARVEDRALLRVDGSEGHVLLVDHASALSVSSGGGTGVAIVGGDNGFKITLGTAPGTTAMVVNFIRSYANAPIVIAQYENDHILLRAVATTSGVTITPASSMSAGHVINVIIIGRVAS